jgi:hypothetical protein
MLHSHIVLKDILLILLQPGQNAEKCPKVKGGGGEKLFNFSLDIEQENILITQKFEYSFRY